MNNEKLEKLGGILFLSAIVIFATFLLFRPSNACLRKEKLLAINLRGIVVEKFYDKMHSNAETITLFNDNRSNINVVCHQELKSFYYYIQIGDSIYKPKDVLEIKVFRENFDTTFIFNYDCNEK